MFLLLGTQLALATGLTYTDTDCPLGDGKVRQYHKVSANTLGGYDSDLATYSTRGQFREFAVSTCPDNYFSALGTMLGDPVPDDKRGAVIKAIDASRATWMDSDRPEVWERYDTAARIAEALGRDNLSVAELYIMASWTARDRAVGVYVGGLDGPQAAKEILDIGATELAKSLTPEAEKVLRYNLARVAHRGGFMSDRDAHLDAYLSLTTLSGDERAAGERLKTIARVVEPALQRKAIAALKAALASAGSEARLVRARYQLADLQRRVGETAAAKRDFHLVVQSTAAPDDVRQLAKYLLGTLGG